MLKRLYVHNYKCLVNFEINFDQDVSLFLGANGSGKSTVFEVLSKLIRLIVDEEKIGNVFDFVDSPRWLDREKIDIQFELDFEINSSIYKYSLVIVDYVFEPIIKKEMLSHDGSLIIGSENGEIFWFDEAPMSFDSTRSVINRYPDYSADFLNYIKSLFVVKVNPFSMTSTINKTNSKVKIDLSNFAEWFAYLNEKNRRGVSIFENAMRDVLSEFDFFKIEQAGQAKILQVEFKNKSNKKEIISYYFNELSEGQKVLITLYTLIYCTPDNSIICIDEPENFLALPEIQPWLNAMRDQCSERNLQVILISHHPSLINFLTANSGYWFSREDNHTRIQRITKQNEGGLSFAQLIELGWIYEG